MASLDNRSILVTGGTGSFGQAFVRRLLSQHKPARVVVYSRDELKQFEMQQAIQAQQLRYFIGDVRDEDRLRRAFAGIDTVVHAAAMKQVVASEYNPIECIKTNVMGAENVVNAAIHAGRQAGVGTFDRQGCEPDQSLWRHQTMLRQTVRRRKSSCPARAGRDFRSFATAMSSALAAAWCRYSGKSESPA